jgi:hypothetical protein
MSPSRSTVSRRRDIETAIAAYNADQAARLLLPPEATRLLEVMFPRGSVCQRGFWSLVALGFDERALRALLRALTEAGFLSKDEPPRPRGVAATYHLHLPPVRR